VLCITISQYTEQQNKEGKQEIKKNKTTNFSRSAEIVILIIKLHIDTSFQP
jgi:hypothetical protein